MGTGSNVRKKVSQQKSKTNSKNTEQNKSKKTMMDSTKSKQKKKIWSFDALVEVMQPSAEELEYREEKARETNFVQKYSKLFKCTKCQLSIKPIVVEHKKVPVHPCLGVLMCQKCCDYYEDGEFSLDSDGEDKYCRWCGEGGTIFSCSKCICGFCAACIKLHFKIEYFKEVQKDENWLCFFCNPKPLWDLRFICSLAKKMSDSSMESFRNNEQSEDSDDTGVKEDKETPARSPKKRKLLMTKRRDSIESPDELKDFTGESTEESQKLSICISSSEESDSETPVKKVRYTSTPLDRKIKNVKMRSFENRKTNALVELKKILTLSKHQMEFGVTWSRDTLDKITTPDYITSNTQLAKECQKVKQFLSVLSTFLVQYINAVDSMEKTLSKNDEKIVRHDTLKDQSSYTNILQFLGFIRGQVKAFMEKGISLSDILEAEVYDDEKIIGILKKTNSSSVTSSQNRSKASSCGASSSVKSNIGTGSRENSENNSIDELEKIRDDDILELVANQTMQKEDFDMDEEYEVKDQDSSHTTLGELNDIKGTTCPKDDIRDILAILENA